ncbi:unnamed protein product [Ascophyllum nodosum]
MKLSIPALVLCLLGKVNGFLAPPSAPRFVTFAGRPASEQCKMMVSAEHCADAAVMILSSATTLVAVGAAEPGTVDAPAWVLPAGALAVVLTAGLIPLLLKPGDDAAKDMQDRDEALWEQNKK